MRHRGPVRFGLVAGVVATLAVAAPVGAITNGTPDDGKHPYVGQLFYYDPDEPDSRFTDPGTWFNCTGTLISPTVVLTAGHCTFATGSDGESTRPDGWGGHDTWVSFEAVPDYSGLASAPFVAADDNPARYESYAGILDGRATWHRGTAYPHPDFDDAAFYLADAGVVILDEPYDPPGDVDFARLARLDYLDQFTGNAKAQTLFEAVGYGFEYSRPKLTLGGDTRMTSQQVLVNSKGVHGVHDQSSILFSNNNGTPHRGGNCYGDSGGPFFRGNTNLQVGISSYGVQPNCTGNDGVYRIDQADDVRWLKQVMDGRDPRFD